MLKIYFRQNIRAAKSPAEAGPLTCRICYAPAVMPEATQKVTALAEINKKPRRSGAGIAFLCGGEAMLCKCFHQCLVVFTDKGSVLVNDVIAYREAIGRILELAFSTVVCKLSLTENKTYL